MDDQLVGKRERRGITLTGLDHSAVFASVYIATFADTKVVPTPHKRLAQGREVPIQPHWYMTCFPFLPLTCLCGCASSVGVAGPALPPPPHAFTGVLLLLCLITPAPE